MDDEINSLRARIASLAGLPLDDEATAHALADAIKGGAGVYIEIDESTRYRLFRRDGKFQLNREGARARASTLPPRR